MEEHILYVRGKLGLFRHHSEPGIADGKFQQEHGEPERAECRPRWIRDSPFLWVSIRERKGAAVGSTENLRLDQNDRNQRKPLSRPSQREHRDSGIGIGAQMERSKVPRWLLWRKEFSLISIKPSSSRCSMGEQLGKCCFAAIPVMYAPPFIRPAAPPSVGTLPAARSHPLIGHTNSRCTPAFLYAANFSAHASPVRPMRRRSRI